MGPTEKTRATPAKIFMACVCCKTRKRRCDGGTPKCANCIARGVDCSYAAVRKTRGPGKKKTQTGNHDDSSGEKQHKIPKSSLPENDRLKPNTSNETGMEATLSTDAMTVPFPSGGAVVNQASSLPPVTSTCSSLAPPNVKNRIPLFPDFLLPGTFDEHLQKFKVIMAEANSTQNFTPLMPLHISRRLIENSFVKIMEEHQLLDLSKFMMLLTAQYAASSSDPAENPARWAIVNTILALGVRVKTAPGSEGALSDITNGFYQNAIKVLPELILQTQDLLTVQALLAMAMFARSIPDIQAFIMLATNASRQLELLSLCRRSGDHVMDMAEIKQYEQVYKMANEFDKTILGLLNPIEAMHEETSAY